MNNSFKVMLVEDDDFTRSTLKVALKNSGLDIAFDTAFVKEAIEWARANNVTVAVLDYNLGKGPSGIDLAHSLRSFLPDVGIIILTALLDPAQRKEKEALLPAGSIYLVKQEVTEIEKLVEAIQEVGLNPH